MKEDKTTSPAVEGSVILHGLTKLFSRITAAFGKSLLFSFFFDGKKRELAEKSVLYKKIETVEHKLDKGASGIKKIISKQFSESKILKLLKNLRYSLLKMSIRSFGIGVLLFGAYSTAISILRHYFSDKQYLDSGILIGIFCIIVSLVMLVSSKPIINLLCNSVSVALFIENIACLRPQEVYNSTNKPFSVNVPVFLGSALGLASFFVEPIWIIMACAIIIYASLVFFSPEFAINMLIILMPFLAEKHILILILLAFASYLLKLIRGKRVFIAEIDEIIALLVGIIGTVRCLINPGGSYMRVSLALAIPLLYVCVRNMFRSRRLSFALAKTIGYSFFIVYGLRIAYCLCDYMGISTAFTFKFPIGLSDLYAINEYGLLSIGFVLFSFIFQNVFLRRLFLGFILSLYSTVILITENYSLAILLFIIVLAYLVASRQKSIMYGIPFAAVMPLCYILFKDNEYLQGAMSVFTTDKAIGTVLTGRDFLFTFGIGGMFLLVVFIVSYFSKRMAVKCGNDSELRSLYAATTCGIISLFLYMFTNGVTLKPTSLMLIVIISALASTLNHNGKNLTAEEISYEQ